MMQPSRKFCGRFWENKDCWMGQRMEKELTPGEHFPDDMTAPSRDDILSELAKYGFASKGDISLIDTSHDRDDIRLNYIIDKKWVLRFNKAPEMTEKRIRELNRLIERYKDFGLQAPAFLPDKNDRYFHEWNGLIVYLAEYVDLPTAYELDSSEWDAIWQEVLDSVAGFAQTYKNVDLIDTMGMYSLFDLAPYDKEVGKDEKQQNFEMLIDALKEVGEPALIDKLTAKHKKIRENLRKVYRELPRCVFQADENLSNILVDEQHHMAGLIDFNMAGTEVIVNQFANLGGGFDEENKEPIGASARWQYAKDSYQKYQDRMLRIYHATEQERLAMKWYTWIALAAGWPQVCFFRDGLKDEKLKQEILDLLGILADLPDNE